MSDEMDKGIDDIAHMLSHIEEAIMDLRQAMIFVAMARRHPKSELSELASVTSQALKELHKEDGRPKF